MVTKEEFYYRSSDEKNRIHAVRWIPDVPVIAVLQICHGMCEYIERYDEFATFLAQHGIVVTGNDLLGHGLSVKTKADYGCFCDYLGNAKLVSDMLKLKCITSKEYSQVPYFLFGHSLGSLLTREFLIRYKEGIDGAILMGTMHYATPLAAVGKGICSLIGLLHGNHMNYKSGLIHTLAFGYFEKKFPKEHGRSAWISSVPEEVKKFNHDPFCHITYSVGAYRDLCDGLMEVNKPSNIQRMKDSIPMYIMSGDQDPVGRMSTGVKQVYKSYKDAGLDVRMRIYKGCRHELLHEFNKEKVYQDVLQWITEQTNE